MRTRNLTKFWAWYRRLGEPIAFKTRLSVEACRRRLQAQTVPWETRNPFGLRAYKLQFLSKNEFKLQHRRVFLIQRPFLGQLQETSSGGTLIRGYVANDLGFLRFALFIAIAAPIAGGLTYGSIGWIGGFTVGGLMLGAAVMARVVEGKPKSVQNLHQWLRKTLDGESMIIEGPGRLEKK